MNLEDRRILCTCRPCTLLFTHAGAGSDGTRTATRRCGGSARCPSATATTRTSRCPTRDWDELAIPVRMAFFFRNSGMGRTVAFYPSPAGATESELPLDAWVRVLAANPAVADAEPDVEALLVDRGSGAYLVPIDACYELVGLVRLHWKGFDGGEEAWEPDRGVLRRPARPRRARGQGGRTWLTSTFACLGARPDPYAASPTLVVPAARHRDRRR